jgi:PIN domain nuclease of toxin-antitoxin system
MRYLIDSHVLLWLIAESDKIGAVTKKILMNSDSRVYVSLASLWELNLKANKGRLPISSKDILAGTESLGVGIVEVKMQHVEALSKINIDHLDPFDLMLCAQSKSEDMTLVTADQVLLHYFQNSIDARL